MNKYYGSNQTQAFHGILGSASYYDSPEGVNPWQKVWGLSKYVIPTSMVLTITDSLFFSQTKNFIETANVAAFWTVPLLGVTATFASVAFMGARIRGKEDRWNYMAGAVACAPVIRAWTRSADHTANIIGYLVIFVLLQRNLHNRGIGFNSDATRYEGNYRWDFSLTGEWPRRPY